MKRWSEDDEIYLDYYLYSAEERSYNSAAEFLGRPSDQVIKKANKMRAKGECLNYMRRPFSGKEIKYIKDNYKNISTELMAEYLRRSRDTIIEKANELGITKLKRMKDYDYEIRRLAKEGKYRAEIARMLGLNKRSVSDYITRNAIKCDYASRDVMGKSFRDDEYIRHFNVFRK